LGEHVAPKSNGMLDAPEQIFQDWVVHRVRGTLLGDSLGLFSIAMCMPPTRKARAWGKSPSVQRGNFASGSGSFASGNMFTSLCDRLTEG